ncbi:uncharacterized protein LOC115355845 [Myripristis murdjan]|uniref:uncharacterized protein LOC115355845 n=1 Tax=Myripristis murdjan TaxID=586833 RepID=UPI00117638E1|nr:uncharacterized protein LOC115355845 [Myripristis murdjan]
MAAIDLQRGLEHSGRGWGQERPELMDSFDSEMQEWEDQLQDMQRKIEELYNEVQARRGGNDVTIDNRKNGREMEYGLGHHGNGFFDVPDHRRKDHPVAVPVPNHHSNGCNYSPNGYGYPVSQHNGYGYCHTNGVSEIGDLLQDYLGQGKQVSRKNNGVRHVHFSDTVKVSQDLPAYQDDIKRGFGNERFGQEQFLGNFEETENRKNRVSHMKSSPCKESSPNKESTGAKPPLRQRDAPAVPPRSTSQLPSVCPDSPALDRKTFTPGVLVDRKCSSPSVLRKFGAMLQENEGKMLTETGVVTHQGAAPEPKCPTPSCQRRALGATTAAGRAPMRVSAQKCQADSDVLTGEMEPGQEWGLATDSARQSHMDQRGGYGSSKGPLASPQQSQRRVQVAGSPKLRPRTNSGAERDIGHGQGERTRRPQFVEPRMDYRISSGSSGTQKIQRLGLPGQSELPSCGRGRDEGLIELLDMLEIQHEYSCSPRGGHTPCRQDVQQERSPAVPRKSFSRPARPANQRPPSRWASHTPTARITAPSGPMYRSPSPLSRPPSPMARTPSPALKHQSPISYLLHTETVIM